MGDTIDTRAVEESKEVDDQEEQSNSVSSSLSGDTILAPLTYICRTNGGASNDHGASEPTPATAVVRVTEVS